MGNKKFDDLMWKDDIETYGTYDPTGMRTLRYINLLEKIIADTAPKDDAPAEDYEKWFALGAAYQALYVNYTADAKEYCDKERKTGKFRDYKNGYR